MFPYDSDRLLIKEIGRVLKPNGKMIILPLYLHKQYISTVSPNYYGKGTADPDSFECIRTDCWSSVPIGRFYDVDTFERTVLRAAREAGMEATVFSLPNNLVEKDDFVYLKFILQLEKKDV